MNGTHQHRLLRLRPGCPDRAMTPAAKDAQKPPIVLAMTGASGAPYGVRLLELLVAAKQPVALIVSAHGYRLLAAEADIATPDALRGAVGARGWDRYVTVHDDADRGAPPASGSARTRGMVICPCSMATLAAIAAGTSRSLIERAADVTLKERRRLVLVPRETPLSAIHSENMLPHVTRAKATRSSGGASSTSPGPPAWRTSWISSSAGCWITSGSSSPSRRAGPAATTRERAVRPAPTRPESCLSPGRGKQHEPHRSHVPVPRSIAAPDPRTPSGPALHQPLALFHGPWHRLLALYTPVPDEIDAILAIVARDRIGEGERLDREAQPGKLCLQRLEALDLVAQRRGPLEGEPLGRFLHRPLELGNRVRRSSPRETRARAAPVRRTARRSTRRRRARGIYRLRAGCNPACGRSPRHRTARSDRAGASGCRARSPVAQMRRLPARGAPRGRPGDAPRKGPKYVPTPPSLLAPLHGKELGRGAARELDEDIVPRVTLLHHVESWAQLLDQVQLAEAAPPNSLGQYSQSIVSAYLANDARAASPRATRSGSSSASRDRRRLDLPT